MGSVSATYEKVVCRKVCFRWLTKVKKKGLIGLQDSYEDRLVLFNVHMYDEFHVPDVLIVLVVHVKGSESNKSNLINYR